MGYLWAMRFFGCLAFLAVVISACGSGSGTTPAAAPKFSTVLAAGPGPEGSFTPASVVVLFDEQFVEPFTNAQVLVTTISPPPPLNARVTWTSTGPSVVVQQQEPNFATPAPTAPPLGTFVATGSSFGKATVTAQVGAPVNESASIPVYHYPSLSLGCRFRYTPALNFDGGPTRPLDTSSDLYDTIGSGQIGPLDGCGNTAFATAPGTPEVWHVPYGGTFIAVHSLQDFTTIQASQWRSDATQFAPQSGVLLFKTQGGLIVKALLPVGPYEVSASNGVFPY